MKTTITHFVLKSYDSKHSFIVKIGSVEWLSNGCVFTELENRAEIGEEYDCTRYIDELLNSPVSDDNIVTSFRSLFEGANTFNQDIGDWDTSSVTNMAYMFYMSDGFKPKIKNHE